MRKPARNAVSLQKATWYAVVTNALELIFVLIIAAYVIFAEKLALSTHAMRMLVSAAALMVAVASVIDIRDALQLKKILDQMDAMENTIGNMDELNIKLRAQRHDFLNHLQVVYSLMEMQDYQEASAYIEKVYGSITSVSRFMKTASAPINALLCSKVSACEQAGIKVNLKISSSWKGIAIPGWEMCKVLGNLIDNAVDALQTYEDKQLSIKLSEDLHACRFTIMNNGPTIPEDMRASIFEAGVTTKSEGHGMGLFIVRSTLREFGGDITLNASEGLTIFEGWVPREQTALENK